MQPKTYIKQLIEEAVASLSLSVGELEITIEHPSDPNHGDFASSIALQLFGQLKKNGNQEYKNPQELAKALASAIEQNATSDMISSVSIAGPGFINFELSDVFLLEKMSRLEKDPTVEIKKTAKSAVIEYVSPNTNKPLHIGHLRNAVLGYALVGMLREQGWDVHKAIINNDRGLHITKSMWAYLAMGKKSLDDSSSEQVVADMDWKEVIQEWIDNKQNWLQPADMPDEKLHKPDHFVGFWYVKADALAEETFVQKMWQEMLIAWEEKDNLYHNQVRTLWQQLNNWFYQGYNMTRERVGFSFDQEHINYESEIYEAGRKIILEAADKGIFKRLENGAIQAELEETYHLPNKVLLRGDGTGIYMTFDIELTKRRATLGADRLVWVVGSDQKLYFQQLFAVCELLGFGKRENFKHFGYGMVRLPEGKMSSRKGRVIYADDIIQMAVERASEIMHETGAAQNFSPSQLLKTAEIVGLGAIKWTMLSQDPLSNMTFDVETSVSFSGFAGPYVQYTAVRAKSVLAKAAVLDYDPSSLRLNQEERSVLRQIYQYPEVVTKATAEFAPHQICSYLFDLSREFSAFYNKHQILVKEEPETQQFRLHLTQAVVAILSHGLTMLGLRLPEKM